jgi:hypothetical protein
MPPDCCAGTSHGGGNAPDVHPVLIQGENPLAIDSAIERCHPLPRQRPVNRRVTIPQPRGDVGDPLPGQIPRRDVAFLSRRYVTVRRNV